VKKLLLILLLTILPIQYSWSMAAVYCQHESETTSHFGHHGHQHQSLSDEDGDHGGKPVKKAHGDCEVCHHAVQASVPAADTPLMAAGARTYASPLPSQYLSYIAEGPPRPNWTLVA